MTNIIFLNKSFKVFLTAKPFPVANVWVVVYIPQRFRSASATPKYATHL